MFKSLFGPEFTWWVWALSGFELVPHFFLTHFIYFILFYWLLIDRLRPSNSITTLVVYNNKIIVTNILVGIKYVEIYICSEEKTEHQCINLKKSCLISIESFYLPETLFAPLQFSSSVTTLERFQNSARFIACGKTLCSLAYLFIGLPNFFCATHKIFSPKVTEAYRHGAWWQKIIKASFYLSSSNCQACCPATWNSSTKSTASLIFYNIFPH